jgi:hypothetical protein
MGWPKPDLRLLAIALALACASAPAADSSEFWPEAQLFIKVDDRTRVLLNSVYADERESDQSAFDLAAYVDVSLKPIRKELASADWQRSRYFWVRLGYARIYKSDGVSAAEVTEDRAVVAVYGKLLLPAEVVAEARVRADLRWIGDDYTTRYRYRIELTREFTVADHAVTPFLNYELMHDIRYDGWSRSLLQFGPEVTVGPHFRYELYLARQIDYEPTESRVDAFGLNLKWYF